MFLSDKEIKKLVASGELIITNFVDQLVRERNGEKVLSYGLGPAGYDVRLTNEWRVFHPKLSVSSGRLFQINDYQQLKKEELLGVSVVDPKAFDESVLRKVVTNEFVIWPGQYVLAATLETFKIPTDVSGTFFAKSSYARCGLILNTTNMQPGFEGQIVMEFHNPSPLPIVIRADEGFAQLKLEYSNESVEQSYAEVGKYQGQTGVQTPKA